MFARQTILLAGTLCALTALSACGQTQGERALSGGAMGAAAGAGVGALTGGSAVTGALIGGAAGAATGAMTDPDDINFDR